MSWLSGYKAKPSAQEAREEKRLKLEAERLDRAKRRAAHQKQLQAAIEAQAEAEEALQDLLNIDPDILADESSVDFTDKEVEELQYAPNCLEHRKCIKMDFKCPTIVLNCLHILDYIFMIDLKSLNLHMGTHKGQNS